MDKIKRFDFKKLPRRPTRLLYLASVFLCFPRMLYHRLSLNKIGMKGLKPPYLLLCNHASEMDFYLMFRAIFPHLANYVVAIDGFHDKSEFLMRFAGSIGKRKFTRDPFLLKNLRYCVENLKTIIALYSEARYTFDGTTSYLSPTTGSLVKRLGIPVVMLNTRGCFLSCPQWNKEYKFSPLEARMELIITAEEIKTLSSEKINDIIKKNFVYDDFAYQKEKAIKISHPRRAKGLNRILYKCSSCLAEGEMTGEGTTLTCGSCGKVWEMTEYGELKAKDGSETFTHIPDWYAWERDCVREEVISGEYYFEDEIFLETLPWAKKFIPHGDGRMVQNKDGVFLELTAYGEKINLAFPPLALESLHVEFDYRKIGDCFDISTLDDSFWCYPKTKRDVVMKAALAAEEMYILAYEKIAAGRAGSRHKNQNSILAAQSPAAEEF